MSGEANKTLPSLTRHGDLLDLMIGRGIDIGCGDHPLLLADRPEKQLDRWDIEQGDAQTMLGIHDATYDAVFSAHCLEHLADVPKALSNWARILKPGGAMIVIVPDFMLYERWCWPSRFNSDHKAAFTLFDCHLSPPVSAPNCPPVPFYGFKEMRGLGLANKLELVDARLSCDHYDLSRIYDLNHDQTRNEKSLAQVIFVYRKQADQPA